MYSATMPDDQDATPEPEDGEDKPKPRKRVSGYDLKYEPKNKGYSSSGKRVHHAENRDWDDGDWG